jgi:aspartyl-tRNA(Asn)/glutamyl-tRNA(Gln) amidotransferase subunit B
MVGAITKYMNDTGTSISETLLTPEYLAELVSVTEEKIISSSGAKTLLNLLIENGGNISQLIKENGLAQNSDSDFIDKIAHEVIDNNTKSVSDYKNGKTNALGYLVGQGMKLSKGSASPQMLRDALIKILTEE